MKMFEPDEDTIQKLFNKKFNFERVHDYNLPDSSALFTSSSWTIDCLQDLKENLNTVKSKLNDKKIEVWSEHTKFMNPNRNIINKVRGGTFRGEFVTQAWCKFYECLSNYDIVRVDADDSNHFTSLHLCEAPGSFIAALNHYLTLNQPDVDWNWRATTLNPYYEGNALTSMISDDRLILHTLAHWDFGVDSTGNIMNPENVEHLLERTGLVDLVTADGSIDCLLEPERQEEIVAGLHLSETVVALRGLKQGGSFVLKMFTMFEASSVSLLFLLNCLFRQVHVFKPSVSKEGNSEVYVICLDYTPTTPNTQDYLQLISTKMVTNNDSTLFPLASIPEQFLSQIEACARYFMDLQVAVIERNLSTFNQLSQYDQASIRKLQSRVTNEYITICRLQPIPTEKRLLASTKVDNGINLNPRRHVGSYVERKTELSDEEHLATLQTRLRESLPMIGSWIKIPLNSGFAAGAADEVLQLTKGLPIKKLCSSKFIFAPELRLFQEVIERLSKRCEESGVEVVQCTESQKEVVLNVNVFAYFNYRENYAEFEQNLVIALLEALKTLPTGKRLVIRNLPLLTQFLAGLVFYLSNFCFTKTTLYNESVISFEGEINRQQLQPLMDALELKTEMIDRRTVIGLVDIPKLFCFQFQHALIQYNTSTLFLYNLEYLRRCDS